MSFSNVSKQVVMSFCVAGVALCDIPTCLITCGKYQNWRMYRRKCSFFLHPRVSSRVSGFPVASPCLWGKLRTPHSTLYTPHSTIYTLDCLSPFFSLLSFLRKGVLFHHDLLVPLGSGWDFGACLPSSLFFLSSGKGFCSIMICWFLLFRLGFRCLSPFFSLLSFLRKGVLFHHDLLIPLGSGWGSGAYLPSSLFFGSGVVSLLLFSYFPQDRGFIPI